MSPNAKEPNYRRRRTRARADHDDAPLQQASEPQGEQQAEAEAEQFSEHAALGSRMAGAGSTDGQAGAIAGADPTSQAAMLAGMQRQQGNQHVQSVVQRLRVQRYPNKQGSTDDTAPQTDTPKLIDAIATKYPHLAKVLTTEQLAIWQKLVDAGAKREEIFQQRRKAGANLVFNGSTPVGGTNADMDRYERLSNKFYEQEAVMNQNRWLDVSADLLLDADVQDPKSQEPTVIAFHTRLYNRLVSSPIRLKLGGEVTSVETFKQSPWPVSFYSPVFESELGQDGGKITWMNLMKASEGLAMRYQLVLLEAQKQVLGQMMDISSSTYSNAARDKMLEDIFKIRRTLQNNIVSDGDEADILAIVRKWADADATADEATKRGLATHNGRTSDTPLFDEFIGMLRTTNYDFKSVGTAWTGQTGSVFDGLWEEMEGQHVQQWKDLLGHSKLWANSGRMVPKRESVWSYVGKREALGAWGIVSALGQGLTGLFDLGMWLGYRAAGGEGDAPAITPWLAKQQDKVANLMAGGMGVNLAEEHGLFGLDPFHFARITGKVPAALMTAGMMGPLGEAGVAIGAAQTVQQLDALVDKIQKMRAAGKSWGDIFSDPTTWVQIVGVVAGAIGTAGGLAEAGSASKELLGQMGIVANVGQMELIAAAYYAVDDDSSIPGPEKQQRKADLLADFLSTGTMTIDQRYGEAFKQRWEARYSAGVADVGGARESQVPINEPDPVAPKQDEATSTSGSGGSGGGSAPKDKGTAKSTGGAHDEPPRGATTQDDSVKAPADTTETPTGGGAYYGKRPPPIPLNKKGFNHPVGEPFHSLEQGRALMRRLAEGDAGALTAVGVKLPENYNPLGREWGLGKTTDGKFVLIEGGTGGVKWDQLIAQGIEPVSHSHPLFKGREMTNPGVTIPELINGINMADKIHVLVSVSDIAFCAGNKLGWHEVQIPYAHLGDGKIGNWTGNEPGVSIVIHDAKLVGESPDMYYYKSELEFVSGGKTVWKGEVWAWSNFVRGPGNFSTTQPEHFSRATPTETTPTVPTTETQAGVAGPMASTAKTQQNTQKPPVDTAVINWGKKLGASGNRGSLGNKRGYGVFEASIPGVAKPVVVKVYPKSLRDVFDIDIKGAEAAGTTGLAAKFYGQIDVGPGKLAFAMEKLEGGFVNNESLAPVGSKEHNKAEQQAAFYASRVTQQTIADIRAYRQQVIDAGFYYDGEVQGMVDAQGRWKAMDFQGMSPLPTDPAARNQAIQDHVKNFRSMIDEIRAVMPGTP